MRIVKIILFIVMIFSFSSLHAQNFKRLVKEGNTAFEGKDFYTASMYYRKAMNIDSTVSSVNYGYAEASRIMLEYKHAEKWYGVVYKADRGKKFRLASFWQAVMMKNIGKYKEAKALFEKFATKNKKKTDFYLQKAQYEITACDVAVRLKNDPKPFIIEHPDSAINSVHADFNPVDANKKLYFSSIRKSDGEDSSFFSALYSSEKDDSKWKKASIEESELKGENISNICFSPDNKNVFFTVCKYKNPSEIICEIYSGEFSDGKFKKFKRLNDDINKEESNNTQPFIASLPDNTSILYFASDRPGGYGNMDIWSARISKDGKYGKAENAGNKINSIDDEITPFYHAKTSTLYFSSAWHKGLGGFDIFKSKADSTGKWTDPVNVGYPLNSSYNDLYFSMNENEDEGFFTSNRPGSFTSAGEACCNDIYTFHTARKNKSDTTIVLTEQKSEAEIEIQMLVPLTLYFHNDEPDPRTRNNQTKRNYIDVYNEYLLLKPVYRKSYSHGLSGDTKIEAEEDIDDFFHFNVDKGMEDLQKFSELLLKNLMEGKDVTITLKGYCSPLASTDYNVNLARRRISSLRNYFDQYKDGILKQYMNRSTTASGHIDFVEEDVGELEARSIVSDNPNDQRNSIYSRLAALERKIQIIAVSTKKKTSVK